MAADPAESLGARIRSALPAPALMRVSSEEAEDMGAFLINIRTDLRLARESCAAVARLFPAWTGAMARLTEEIAALEAEAQLYAALAEARLAPAPAGRTGLAAFEAASAGERG
jgi:hypothetical protein